MNLQENNYSPRHNSSRQNYGQQVVLLKQQMQVKLLQWDILCESIGETLEWLPEERYNVIKNQIEDLEKQLEVFRARLLSPVATDTSIEELKQDLKEFSACIDVLVEKVNSQEE